MKVGKVDIETLDYLLDRLSGRRVFYYYRDRYAFALLARACDSATTVASLKRNGFGRLLQKDSVRKCLAFFADGKVDPVLLENVEERPYFAFVLGYGQWAGMHRQFSQVSRRGYNLVLQLNFSGQHDNPYNRLYKPIRDGALNCHGHPIAKRVPGESYRETLAWARIDVDLDNGVALIEEIQSDWVRLAGWRLEYMLRMKKMGISHRKFRDCDGSTNQILEYLETVLAPYAAVWEEAILTLAIIVLCDELQIRNIYYHSFESGGAIKAIKDTQPPRRLYSRLPRRFCFEKTTAGPEFIERESRYRRLRRKVNPLYWYNLRLDTG